MELQSFGQMKIGWHGYNTVIVGTGAAGYSAADRLRQFGQADIAVLADDVLGGTSRNAGSDKQTYYKLSLSGSEPDSVDGLAGVLFNGQCVDGEHAMCEAAMSARCFMHLVELGVPFPYDRYGEYIGYKTDHDPGKRATSAGPYTSAMMTKCLERSVKEKGVPVFGHMQLLRILTKDNRVRGVLCLNTQSLRYEVFRCKNLILATGGPAGMYADSVYPYSQFGATGAAFEAGAAGKNLTEWQNGLASIKPRWNVSGTYMQVLPRFISTDRNGEDPREFLPDYFETRAEMLSNVFLKGYQWPFHVSRVLEGSSIIDLLVYQECHLKNRRVFLDYRENPGGEEIDYRSLAEEARTYLSRAGACFGKPIDRLEHMNAAAIELYRGKGVDLRTQPLEIALCVQHNSGGLSVDSRWQTDVEGLFAVGEVSGTHGVYRPGGSALNSGQVGALRAAQYISARGRGEPASGEELLRDCGAAIREIMELGERARRADGVPVEEAWQRATRRMSGVGAAIRDTDTIRRACAQVKEELDGFSRGAYRLRTQAELSRLFRLRETLLCQYVYLEAMADYAARGGASRGGALYFDPEGTLPRRGLPECFRFRPDNGALADMVQEISYTAGRCAAHWRKVRPLPQSEDFFENVWREFRENGGLWE